MVINHNMLAINTHRQLGITGTSQQKSMEKLSSGMRINRAGDDAAGLSISEKMRGQIRGLKQASRNAQDGISLIQTAEGALSSVNEMLTRIKELATQAANGTYDQEDDLARTQEEVVELAKQIEDIETNTKFNGISLLAGGSVASGVYTKKTGVDVDGVTSNVLQNSGGENVAIEISGEWYAADDVVKDGSVLKAKEGAEKLTATPGKQATGIDGILEAKTAQKVTVGAKEFSNQDVLVDESGNAVAVKVGGSNYYKLNDVEQDGSTSNLKVKAGSPAPTALTLKDVVKVQPSGSDAITLQIGNESTQKLDLNKSEFRLSNVTAAVKGYDLSTQEGARTCLDDIENQINAVSASRSYLGANQNRLEYTIRNLDTSAENLQAAESRIRDVDMAQEMMSLTKQNILQQAAQSMLAQANQAPQGVLQLLR